MKNEKVAKGRIIGFAGPCFLIVSPFFGAPGPTQEPGPHSAAKRHPKTLFPISHPTTRPPRSLSPSNSHCGKTPSQGTKFIQILYGIRDKHVCPCLTFNTPFFISFQNFDLQLHTRFAHVFRAAFSIFGVTLPWLQSLILGSVVESFNLQHFLLPTWFCRIFCWPIQTLKANNKQ